MKPFCRLLLLRLTLAFGCLCCCTPLWAGEPLVFWSASIAPGRIAPAQIAQVAWQPVALADAWRRQKPCRSGEWTYLAEFDLAERPADAFGLFIHRAGNRLRIWVNHTPVASFGDLDNPRADYSNAPLYAQLPPQVLQPGKNRVLIQVAGDCRRYAGLSHFEIGEDAQLAPRWGADNRWFVWQSAAIISICSILGILSLGVALWRRDRYALMFAAISGFGALRAMLWAMTELPMPYELWFFLIDFSYGVWAASITLLALDLCEAGGRWLRRGQWLAMFVFCCTSIATALGAPTFWKNIGLEVTLVACTASLVSVWLRMFRYPDGTNLAIGLAGVLMMSLGTVDHWNIWLSSAPDAYQRYYLTPLTVMLFILSMGIILARRFDRALRSEARYRTSLEAEVRRQRAELEQSYRETQEQIRQEAVHQERERIVREMHDGLGAQLVGILSSMRSTPTAANSVERDIQEALDQLRCTMDTLTSDCEDLATVLAQFRFRNESRFQRAGVRLRWQVRPLPNEQWGPQALLHFERMLREIFANILKHAQASEVRVDAGCQAGECHIEIADNGLGCELADPAGGRGLRHLRERARELGVTLTLTAAPGEGMCVRLTWPHQATPPAA